MEVKHFTISRSADIDDFAPSWLVLANMLRGAGFSVVTNDGDKTEVVFKVSPMQAAPKAKKWSRASRAADLLAAIQEVVPSISDDETAVLIGDLCNRIRLYRDVPGGTMQATPKKAEPLPEPVRLRQQLDALISEALPAGEPLSLDGENLRRRLIDALNMPPVPEPDADPMPWDKDTSAAVKTAPRDVLMRQRLREAIESAFPFDPTLPSTEYERDLKRVVLMAADLPFRPDAGASDGEARDLAQARQELTKELYQLAEAHANGSSSRVALVIARAVATGII